MFITSGMATFPKVSSNLFLTSPPNNTINSTFKVESMLLFVCLFMYSRILKLQRFPFVDKNRYLYKAFEEDFPDLNGWTKHLEMDKVIGGKILRKYYKIKHQFLRKKSNWLLRTNMFFKLHQQWREYILVHWFNKIGKIRKLK